MKIAEYTQIDMKIIEEEVVVDDLNEFGEYIGNHKEIIKKRVPVMGLLWRDATDEEEKELIKQQFYSQSEDSETQQLYGFSTMQVLDEFGNVYEQYTGTDGIVHSRLVESYTGELFK